MAPVKQIPLEKHILTVLDGRGRSGCKFGELAQIILRHKSSFDSLDYEDLEPLDSVKLHILRMIKERQIELAFTTGGPICYLTKYVDDNQIGKNILSLVVVKEKENLLTREMETDWTQTIMDIILQSPIGIEFDDLYTVFGCSMSAKSLGMRVGSLSKKNLIVKDLKTNAWMRAGNVMSPVLRRPSVEEPIIVESKAVMVSDYHYMTAVSIRVDVLGLPSTYQKYDKPTRIKICADCNTTTGLMFAASCTLIVTDPHGGQYQIHSPEGKRLTIELA